MTMPAVVPPAVVAPMIVAVTAAVPVVGLRRPGLGDEEGQSQRQHGEPPDQQP
ncbi:MAG: hypothetical protein RIC54_01175 [Thalassobaculum sp.]|uniref:hypothetical protein n=1 Tax=Thalassobaculum sp. TaxID=2022740 RepID=UPI0032ECBC50